MTDNIQISKSEEGFPDLRLANSMTKLDAAVLYASIGWAVLPLEEGGKVPHPHHRMGWTTGGGTTDPDTARRWWTELPDANIGIICGERSGVICLDLDNKPDSVNGVDLFRGTHEDAGGPAASTPSGGVHRVFRYDPDVRNMSPYNGGFDLLVSNRQFVVAPSTTHVGRYQWTNTGAPVPLPPQVIERAREGVSDVARRNPGHAPPVPALGKILDYASHSIVPRTRMPDGRKDRSTGAYMFALELKTRLGSQATDGDILATLWAVPEYMTAAQERRGDDASALEWLWRYCAWRAEVRNQFDGVELPDGDYDPRFPHEMPPGEAVGSDGLHDLLREGNAAEPEMITAEQMVREYGGKDIPFLIPRWLPIGELTLLVGEDGLGKSMIVQRLATQLAAGLECLDRPQSYKGVRCLMIFSEDQNITSANRQKSICASLGIKVTDLNHNILYLREPQQHDVKLMGFNHDHTSKEMQFFSVLERNIVRHRIQFVVLDPLSYIYADEENNRIRVGAFTRGLTALAQRHQCAMLLIGHPAKAEGSEWSGSTAWSAGARARWLLTREDDNDPINSPLLLEVRKLTNGIFGATQRYRRVGATIVEQSDEQAHHVAQARHRDIQHLITHTIREGAMTFSQVYSASERAGNYIGKIVHEQAVDAHNRRIYGLPEVKAAVRSLIQENVLDANVAFDGKEGRPVIRYDNTARRKTRTGVWFAKDPPTILSGPLPDEHDLPYVDRVDRHNRTIDHKMQDGPDNYDDW